MQKMYPSELEKSIYPARPVGVVPKNKRKPTILNHGRPLAELEWVLKVSKGKHL